jgi:glycerophosphoryl diester phosphodiesterase
MRTKSGALLLVAALFLTPAGPAASEEHAPASSCVTTPAIAHRGITTAHTENTLGAVAAAVAAGAPFEVDLRSTSDHQVVVMHDATIDRTTNGRGQVATMTADQIRQHLARDGQEIPFVEDVLDLLAADPTAYAHLELKVVSEPAMAALAEAVAQRGVLDQISVDSFSAALIAAFRHHHPGARVHLIHPGLPPSEAVASDASVFTRLMNQTWVDAVRARGFELRARHDDGPDRFQNWELGLKYGVKAFMTDRLWEYRGWCQGMLRRPDALLSRLATEGFVGDDVYNTKATGQSLRTTARRKATRTFYVRISNDGTEPATYAVTGSAPRPRSRVRYWSPQGVDVTAAVRSAGGWSTSLQPGGSTTMRVTITVLRRAAFRTVKSAAVTTWWRGQVPHGDTVRAEARVVR